MSIKQLNATYDPLEDRIALKITIEDAERQLQEFRFWLTRARVLWVLGQIDRGVVATLQQRHSPERAEQLASFQQEALAGKRLQYAVCRGVVSALGDAPQLVHHMQLTWGEVQWVWQLQLASGSYVTLTLPETLMAQTRILLEQISVRATWMAAPSLAAPSSRHEKAAHAHRGSQLVAAPRRPPEYSGQRVRDDSKTLRYTELESVRSPDCRESVSTPI
jgi:hypothetical protein